MQELEKLTYSFAIESASLIKSLEKIATKDFSDLQELKRQTAGVSLTFMDAIEARENKVFSNNLRTCLHHVQATYTCLQTLDTHQVAEFDQQKTTLIQKCEKIKAKLEEITKKLIQ